MVIPAKLSEAFTLATFDPIFVSSSEGCKWANMCKHDDFTDVFGKYEIEGRTSWQTGDNVLCKFVTPGAAMQLDLNIDKNKLDTVAAPGYKVIMRVTWWGSNQCAPVHVHVTNNAGDLKIEQVEVKGEHHGVTTTDVPITLDPEEAIQGLWLKYAEGDAILHIKQMELRIEFD